MSATAGVNINVKNPSFFSDFDKVWKKCREILVQRHITAFREYQPRDVRRHICHLADGEQDAAPLTFRHRASCILGQAFRSSPENDFCILNQQIYFIV